LLCRVLPNRKKIIALFPKYMVQIAMCIIKDGFAKKNHQTILMSFFIKIPSQQDIKVIINLLRGGGSK